jgi:hypothetical protein
VFLKELIFNIQPGDFLISCSFVLHDEAQGFRWNNAQATIHPFVIISSQVLKYRA